MRKLTKKQRLEDEMILAAIIAGGMASGREVRPSVARRPGQPGHDNGYGVHLTDDPQGPCCAVGAGLLFAGVVNPDYAPSEFSKAFGVSTGYGSAVSWGFEYREVLEGDETTEHSRGVNVGAAAYDFFCGDQECDSHDE